MRPNDLLRTSRYNFVVPVSSGVLLYNSRTGAARVFAGADASVLASNLCIYPAQFDTSGLDQKTRTSLTEGGFLVELGFDELAFIRDMFYKAKRDAPIIVTVTTTNDCNLGCFYCFQKRGEQQLRAANVPAIVCEVRRLLSRSEKRSLHVDWYGGEPMLNRPFIETASEKLQALSEEMDVRYSASMLTNGTLWPDDPLDFIQRHKISRIQITFDGLRESHNKVRRYRNKIAQPSDDQFSSAVALVDRLFRDLTTDIRFNLSKQNVDEAVEFAKFGKQRGWFSQGSKAKLQLAKLTPYSAEVDFLRKTEIAYGEFERVRDRIRTFVPDNYLDRTAALDRYPHPRESVCAAVASDSIVIGADGRLYNCGLQVTEPHRSVGSLSTIGTPASDIERNWWESFDPTKGERCKACSFLPVCWGACPKLHLEKDSASLEQQSEYWRVMLPRRLAASMKLEIPADFRFCEQDQFRTSAASPP